MSNPYYGYLQPVFSEVIVDYEDFKAKIDPVLFNGEYPSELTFKLIYNRYMVTHLAMNPTNFLAKFSNTLYENYERFEYDMAVKKEARAVTDEEWSNDGESISNTSSAPNEYGDTDSELVGSLDQQNKNILKASKSSVLYRKKDQNKAYSIQTFLDKFKPLFSKFYDPTYTACWVEEE